MTFNRMRLKTIEWNLSHFKVAPHFYNEIRLVKSGEEALIARGDELLNFLKYQCIDGRNGAPEKIDEIAETKDGIIFTENTGQAETNISWVVTHPDIDGDRFLMRYRKKS